jgi:hypothetical protein
MVMFSALRRHHLTDAHGLSARLMDVAVDLSVGDYPQVTQVLYRHKGQRTLAIPWDNVVERDWRHQCLKATDLRVGRAAPDAALKRTVLLSRDVMDALVLDVAAAQAMRANDLWLREEDGTLSLCAAIRRPLARAATITGESLVCLLSRSRS